MDGRPGTQLGTWKGMSGYQKPITYIRTLILLFQRYFISGDEREYSQPSMRFLICAFYPTYAVSFAVLSVTSNAEWPKPRHPARAHQRVSRNSRVQAAALVQFWHLRLGTSQICIYECRNLELTSKPR